jgi:hypothetical protein
VTPPPHTTAVTAKGWNFMTRRTLYVRRRGNNYKQDDEEEEEED